MLITPKEQFIGQAQLLKAIGPAIEYTCANNVPLPHMIFYSHRGGLGKNQLVKYIANITQRPMVYAQAKMLGSNINSIVSVLLGVPYGGILFIDEYSKNYNNIDNILRTLMEGWVVNGVTVPQYTVIIGTNNIECISNPLRTRFNIVRRFEEYSSADLTSIATASEYGSQLPAEVLQSLIPFCKGTPRNLLKLCEMAFYHFSVYGTVDIVSLCRDCGIYTYGLDDNDISILTTLRKQNKPTSRDFLARMSAVGKDAIGDHLAFLMSLCFVDITNKGVKLTELGLEFLQEYCND